MAAAAGTSPAFPLLSREKETRAQEPRSGDGQRGGEEVTGIKEVERDAPRTAPSSQKIGIGLCSIY